MHAFPKKPTNQENSNNSTAEQNWKLNLVIFSQWVSWDHKEQVMEAAWCWHPLLMSLCLHAHVSDKGVETDKGDEKEKIKPPELHLP